MSAAILILVYVLLGIGLVWETTGVSAISVSYNRMFHILLDIGSQELYGK